MRKTDEPMSAQRGTPTTVDAYLAGATKEQRAALTKVRKAIKSAAPTAVEGIGYGIARYRYKGQPLIYFGYAKGHCALYGDVLLDEETAKQLGYELSGKGTLRFPAEKPIADALIAKITKARMAEIDKQAKRS